MRYEYLPLTMSTAALAELRVIMAPGAAVMFRGTPEFAANELNNLYNEIEARLQRTDEDVKAEQREQVRRDIADQTGWKDNGDLA